MCLCEVSAAWNVCVVSGVFLFEVCELCIMYVLCGECLCKMYAQWSVSVHGVR